MKYTKKEFAPLCGQTTKTLAVYASDKHRKVVYDENGMIDTDNPINALFLAKHGHKARNPTDNESTPSKTTKTATKEPLDDGKKRKPEKKNNSELVELATELEKLKVQLQQRKVKQADIDIEKKMGETMPVELVQDLFSTLQKSIILAVRDGWAKDDDLLTLKYKIPPAEVTNRRKEREKALSNASKAASEFAKLQLKTIVSEYSAKRGVGERED